MTSKDPISVTHPELAEEAFDWDPSTLTKGSDLKRKWKCGFNHIWSASVSGRVAGNGCPYCSGRVVTEGVNDLFTLRPEIADELSRQTPEVGAVCGNSARTVLCGGRPVMGVPTAI